MIVRFAMGALGALRNTVLVLACTVCVLAPVHAAKADSDEQAAARSNVKRGGAMSIRDIEGIVLPKMRGMNYVGFTYHPVENVYLLRFMDGPKVVDVEVDAKTGKILWRSK